MTGAATARAASGSSCRAPRRRGTTGSSSRRCAGFGIGWAELDHDADPPVADVRLRPERLIRGRVFDPQGRPARGVAIRVEEVMDSVRGEDPRRSRGPALRAPRPRSTSLAGAGDQRRRRPVHAPRAGPAPVVPALRRRPRFGLQAAMVQADRNDDADPRDIRPAQAPSRSGARPGSRSRSGSCWGRLLRSPARDLWRHRPARPPCPDRRRPGPTRRRRRGAVLHHGPHRRGGPRPLPDLCPVARRCALPDRLEAHRMAQGAAEHSIEIALTRGVAVRGKVVEDGTGRPVAGAIVRIVPDGSPVVHPPAGRPPRSTGADGTYVIAAPPGPGHLVVQGSDDDYWLRRARRQGGIRSRWNPVACRHHACLPRRRPEAPRARPGRGTRRLRRARRSRPRPRPGWPARPTRRDLQPAQPESVADGRMEVAGSARPTGGMAGCATACFALHGLDPGSVPRSPPTSSSPSASWARRRGSRPGRRSSGPVTVRLEPCVTARCARSGPTAGRSLGIRPRDRGPDGRHARAALPAAPGEGRPPVRRRGRPGTSSTGGTTGPAPRPTPAGGVTFPALIRRELPHRGQHADLRRQATPRSARNSPSSPASAGPGRHHHRPTPEEELTCEASISSRSS